MKDSTGHETWFDTLNRRERERELARKREREAEEKTVFSPKTEDCDSVAQSNADEPEGGNDDRTEFGPEDDKEGGDAEGRHDEEDTARLHVALKDPHHAQEGYVADQTPEERQADLDKCCGSDPVVAEKEKPDPVDPDRERLTVDPLKSTEAEIKHLIAQNRARYYRTKVREDVYKLIDGERDYQFNTFGKSDKLNWTPSDWLTLIDRYMIDAMDIIANPDFQMIEIRKIAALAVFAMERIATPARM